MATSDVKHAKNNLPETYASCNGGEARDVREASTQTESKVQGHGPRLSTVNLFTLLSLWMELFPREESPQTEENESTRVTGLVVVQDQRVLGLHCSGPELHAGQVAVIKHGPRLKDCELYFSRKPCSTCLKMVINAGVNRISYWPGDAEISLLDSGAGGPAQRLQEAVLDAQAAERLRAKGRAHTRLPLRPLGTGTLQHVEETSRRSDFLEAAAGEGCDPTELFDTQQVRNMVRFSRVFLVPEEERHRELLERMGLQNLCAEPHFSALRHHMHDMVRLLASAAAAVPLLPEEYGFYTSDPLTPGNGACDLLTPGPGALSQDIVWHCMVQARLLAYRTEDPKVGVGAVIWAEGKTGGCDGTGRLYLLGCGYNAYPAGSEYADYPQMDTKQEDRQNRKYRYIIHAEQNALTFRSCEIREEETTMLFVTKCPCDECVPLIGCAGITQIYTSDLDSGKDKHDISYLRFRNLHGTQKFIWQRKPPQACSTDKETPIANGCLKHSREEEAEHSGKRLRS